MISLKPCVIIIAIYDEKLILRVYKPILKASRSIIHLRGWVESSNLIFGPHLLVLEKSQYPDALELKVQPIIIHYACRTFFHIHEVLSQCEFAQCEKAPNYASHIYCNYCDLHSVILKFFCSHFPHYERTPYSSNIRSASGMPTLRSYPRHS